MYLNLFPDGGVMLETEPNGERSIALELPKRAEETLSHLLACESFLLCEALGELVRYGLNQAGRTVAAENRSVVRAPRPDSVPAPGPRG